MKQIQLNSGVFLLVEVPEGAGDFFVSYEYNPFCVWLHMTGRKYPMPIGNIIYPAKAPEIIGKGNEITEEVWMDIVESAKTFGYRKYDAYDGDYQWTARAKQSGESWVKSHGMKPETVIILKLIKNE